MLAAFYCKHECCIIAKKVVEFPSISSFRIFLMGFGCVYQTVAHSCIVVPVCVSFVQVMSGLAFLYLS